MAQSRITPESDAFPSPDAAGGVEAEAKADVADSAESVDVPTAGDGPDLHALPTGEEAEAVAPGPAQNVSFDGIVIGDAPDQALLDRLEAIGQHANAEVLLITHGRGNGPAGVESLNDVVYQQVRRLAREVRDKNVVLVLDSPGGQADAAYRIARLLQRSTASFSVGVPVWAKSAATLLSLGAEKVYMGSCAEFGPLDVQLFTHEREEWGSALDEVQSLDRITEAAITQADQAMLFLLRRTGKKMETLLPYALDFAAKLQAPMVEKIDTIHYTQQSRVLKVAEDYAVRLMTPVAGPDRAKEVANRLVNAYPEHGFVIDKEEAASMLPIDVDPVVETLLDEIGELLQISSHVLIGRIKKDEGNDSDS